MYLKSIEIKDFKRISSVNLELADVTILVGANGSGKSSVIQALHLASCVMRQVEKLERTRTSTVGVDQLDYLPTENYKMLGHKVAWGNSQNSPSTKVELRFRDGDEETEHVASCEFRSARNAGISIIGIVPPELLDTLRRKNNFFSAYIPGISGIPNREEKKASKVVLKACSYGDSNIILRNALLLLKSRESLAHRVLDRRAYRAGTHHGGPQR